MVDVVSRVSAGSAFQPGVIRRIAGMVSDRFPPVDQQGFEVSDTIADAAMLPGDMLFGVTFAGYEAEARHGSLVLFRVERGGSLESWTLGRAVMQRGARTYLPVHGDIPADAVPIYLLIGIRRDYFLS